MLFAKRREPSGGHLERGQAKHLREDQEAIYEHTLRLLKDGARMSSSPTKKGQGAAPRVPRQTTSGGSGAARGAGSHGHGHDAATGMALESQEGTAGDAAAGRDAAEGTCFVCLMSRQETSCTHCSRAMCDLCSRQCDTCQEVFCTFCSTPNYDERFDRTFCLDCHLEELKRRRRPGQAEASKAPFHLAHSSNGFYGFSGLYSSLGAPA